MTTSDNDDEIRPETTEYFRGLLDAHEAVIVFEENSPREFIVHRQSGSALTVHLTGKYVFEESSFFDLHQNRPEINCVVLGSAWLNYSNAAKQFGLMRQKGLFTMKEFAGALNLRDFWTYVPPKKH